MVRISTNSDSLIGSLCREIDYIQTRGKIIKMYLTNCKSKALIKRLNKELTGLNNRKISIYGLCKEIENNYINESLSLNFLIEVCKRELVVI